MAGNFNETINLLHVKTYLCPHLHLIALLYTLSNANLRPNKPNTLPAILSMYFFVRK